MCVAPRLIFTVHLLLFCLYPPQAFVAANSFRFTSSSMPLYLRAAPSAMLVLYVSILAIMVLRPAFYLRHRCVCE